MGNWNINIQGTGCHHNGKQEIDADLAAVEFVAKLKEQGHNIESASFTSGGKTDLLELASKPLEGDQLILLNGKQVFVKSLLTFEEVVSLAGMTGTPSCTYGGDRYGKSGILSAGRSIEVKSGTVITCVHTGNA